MDSPKQYAKRLKKIVTPGESRLLQRLSSPQKIQNYLDKLPINFTDTYRSPRVVLQKQSAHCIEGALLAAAALAYHKQAPLLLDLRSIQKDDDHVVALFQQGNYWGAISKTNHPVLRFRDPIYQDVRELAVSYFHEYFTDNGRKTLREFSRPFDLRRFNPEKWFASQEELWWLAEALDSSSHEKIARNTVLRHARPASVLERKTSSSVEWKND